MLLRLKRGSFLEFDRSQRVWYGGVSLNAALDIAIRLERDILRV